MTARRGELTAVLDVGKTRVKLLLVDGQGALVAARERANAGVPAAVAGAPYLALDTAGIADWLREALVSLGPLRDALGRIIVSTHGAAFAAMRGDALALPIPDYEFEGFAAEAEERPAAVAAFADTLSPDLPLGLNAATQLAWLARHHGAALAGADTLLPYAQWWSAWLCGQRASEVSSLGCHTHLWEPRGGRFSALATRRGWAARFAPVRRAWEVLGALRPELAQALGLPANVLVHTGVHDTNACLAGYLRSWPRMTMVSTGTWVMAMAPGAPLRQLDAARDLQGMVSVRNEVVPTGRFMGGRELLALCAGADPSLAGHAALDRLLQRGVMALPGFAAHGGPFMGRAGRVVDAAGDVAPASLPEAERATLAALYVAQVTAWIIERLGGTAPVLLDGPMARNPVVRGVLAALLPRDALHVNVDELEGTARGAWVLSHWTGTRAWTPRTEPVAPHAPGALRLHHERWLTRVAGEPG
jgi:sugar (pentulose or hexulose) kinase